MNIESLFNTPLETALRGLILLDSIHPQGCDLQRLIILDFLMLHSADFSNGPESLHPRSPLQAGELSVRRTLFERGVGMLMAKGLIKKEFESTGIQYYATETARVFLGYFDSPYASRAKHVSAWVRDTFQRLPNDALESIVRPIYGTWSLEMSGDSDLEGM